MKIRVTPAIKRGVILSAKRSSNGVTSSIWVRSVLSAVAMRVELPPDIQRCLSPVEPTEDCRRAATVTFRISSDERRMYCAAAHRAQMTLAEWAATVVTVAVGILELPEQLAVLTRWLGTQTASGPREPPDTTA